MQDDLMLNSILLETLDAGAEDYEQQKLEFETKISEIEHKLRGGLSTPTSQVDRHAIPRSGTSLSLPSRDTGNNLEPSDVSPSTHAPKWNEPGWGWPTARDSNHNSASHSAGSHTIKRHRDSVPVPSGDGFKRSRKNSDTPTNSSVSTPASLDSLEVAEREVEAYTKAKPVQYNILARMREEAAQREAQYQKEMKDRDYARSLSKAGAPSFGQSSFPGQQSTQSYFGSDGKFTKPSSRMPPQPVQRPQLSRYGTSSSQQPCQFNAGAYVKPEPSVPMKGGYPGSTHRMSAPNLQPSRRTHQPGSSSKAPITLDDDEEDDDDFQVLHSSARPGAPPYHAADPRSGLSNRSLLNQANGYLPSQPSQPNAGYASSYNPPTFPDYSQGYGITAGLAPTSNNSMIGGSNVYGSAANTLYSGALALGNHVAGMFSGFGGSLASNPIDLDEEYPALPQIPTLEQRLHDRGWDGLNDSTHSREELENLIENIRPDEDIPPELRINTPKELKVVLMEHQKLGLAWLQKQEASNAKGGILADDMGLGKTIQALALIATRPSNDPGRKTTLIVAPVALLRQWKREIEERINPRHKLTVLIYHGQTAKTMTFSKLSSYDIVLTTYGKLASEYKRKDSFEVRRQNDPQTRPRPNETLVLLDSRSKFYRVIVDEAQNIKNANTKSALGALWLNATYRLCMTGTPMMNNVGELYSLIRFLRIPPYDSKNVSHQICH